MIIKKLEVKNFRSILESCLDCDNLAVLVGRNGAGKSSFLYAIAKFYNIAAPISEEDFYNRDCGSPIEIRVTYGDLRDDEKKEFGSFVRDDRLMVTKRISSEDGRIAQRYYAADLQFPRFAEIRALPGKRDRVTAWNQIVDSREVPGLDQRVRRAEDIEELMREYEARNPQLLSPIERDLQFIAAPNIGGGKLDKFTRFVLVPAVREATDEVAGKKGAVYQLIDMIVSRKIDARQDIQQFKIEFDEKVRRLYSSENLTELPELGTLISETLQKFSPGSKLNLGWGEVKLPEVALPPVRATLIEDDFEGEIDRKGHGLQRALILTLLQHLAMTVPIGTPTEGEEPAPESVSRELVGAPRSAPGPDLILAIEEPELYLHPSRCRFLSEVLLRLTENVGIGLGARNQVVYTTHSSHFVDLQRFDRVRMIRKEISPDSLIPNTVVSKFSLQQAAKELARICNGHADEFTVDSFRVHAMPVMNVIVNEGFFADVVVVVEGLSDVGALWQLQEIKRMNWSELGIVIVPAGGKNNIDRPTVLFRGLSIPTYFVFDADSNKRGTREEGAAKMRNHRYQRLAGISTSEDFPDTQVHENWAVFRDDLEGTLSEKLGNDPFQAILHKVALEFGHEVSRVFKNIEGAARVVDLVCKSGYQIPILEEIVEKITHLRQAKTDR